MFTVLNEKPPDGFLWSRERLTKIQATTRPDHLWPEIWSGMSKAAQQKEKLQWAVEEPKLDTARKLEGIYFIEPDDQEFKEIMKKGKEKLDIHMEAAMPCKLELVKRPFSHREIDSESNGSNTIQETKHACIVEAQ